MVIINTYDDLNAITKLVLRIDIRFYKRYLDNRCTRIIGLEKKKLLTNLIRLRYYGRV